MNAGGLYVQAAESVDRQSWNAFVLAHAPRNPLYSTTAWADYWQRWSPARPRFVSVFDQAGDRVCAWLVLVFDLSVLRRGAARRMASALKPFTHELVWQGAPVLAEGASGAEAGTALAGWVRRFARSRVAARIYGGPWLEAAPIAGSRWATIVVPCDGSEDAQWARLKPSARKGIRRAREAGVRVRRIADRAELAMYYDFAESVGQGRWNLNGRVELEAAWDVLRANGCLELFVAERGGEWTGVLGVRGSGAYAAEFGLYSAPVDRTERLHSQDLIKWEILRWASAAGLHHLDLSGVSPHPADDKELGIRRFKEKWGGAYVEYATVPPHWMTPWSRGVWGR